MGSCVHNGGFGTSVACAECNREIAALLDMPPFARFECGACGRPFTPQHTPDAHRAECGAAATSSPKEGSL